MKVNECETRKFRAENVLLGAKLCYKTNGAETTAKRGVWACDAL